MPKEFTVFERLERYQEKLLPRRKFVRRLAKFGLISLAVIAFSLVVGMIGYNLSEGMSWVDAFLNSAMLMGGMGQINPLNTDAGKVFAGFYALYCGLVELIAVGIFAAPIIHRFLHSLHIETEKNKNQ